MSLVALAATALAMFVGTTSASATFHIMQIRSIYRGATPSGAFIELQMWGDGQNLVGGHSLKFFDAPGTATTSLTLPTNVANGQNQSRILIGDGAAPGSPDFSFTGLQSLGNILTTWASGGAVCWDVIDCVSWGNFTGEALLPSPAGAPISGGLSSTMASVRSITPGCATALDAADDTNQSNADFAFTAGYVPRNNSLAPTEVLCIPPTSTPAGQKKRHCKKRKKKTAPPSAYAAKHKKCKKRK
jgi:hypothetical protein